MAETPGMLFTLDAEGYRIQHCISFMDGPTFDEWGKTKYVGCCHCGHPFVGRGRSIREAWDEAQKKFDEHTFKMNAIVGKTERDDEPRIYSYLNKFKTFHYPFRSSKVTGNSR